LTRSTDNPPPLLGAHFSIAGGLEKALYTAADYGCTAAQMFTKNASTWKERDITEEETARFAVAAEKTSIREIAAHTAYLINLAAPDAEKHARSCAALGRELVRASQLAIPYVVLHPGAHMGKGENRGIASIVDSINRVVDSVRELRTRLLIETTAGQGSVLGHRFEQIAQILETVEAAEHIGACLDTCHIFAAGYDIRSAEGVAGPWTNSTGPSGFGTCFSCISTTRKRGWAAGSTATSTSAGGRSEKRAFGPL